MGEIARVTQGAFRQLEMPTGASTPRTRPGYWGSSGGDHECMKEMARIAILTSGLGVEKFAWLGWLLSVGRVGVGRRGRLGGSCRQDVLADQVSGERTESDDREGAYKVQPSP